MTKTGLCATEQCHACAGVAAIGPGLEAPCECDCHAAVRIEPPLDSWIDAPYKVRALMAPRPIRLLCPRCASAVRLERDGEIGCPTCGWVKPPAAILDIPDHNDRFGRKMRTREPRSYGMKL